MNEIKEIIAMTRPVVTHPASVLTLVWLIGFSHLGGVFGSLLLATGIYLGTQLGQRK